MKKISIVLAVSMLLGMLPVTGMAAAKVEKPPVISNSSFAKNATGWSGGTLDAVDAVAKVGNSYRATLLTGSYQDMICGSATMVTGKVYELSFYAKADNEGVRLQPIRVHGAAGWTYLETKTLSTKWEKYTVEFIHPFVSHNGTAVDGTGDIRLRVLDAGTVWIDEVYIKEPGSETLEEDKFTGEEYDPYIYEGTAAAKTDLSGFADTKGHWAENTVVLMKNEGIINGMDDGTFQPDRGITRAEFLKLLTVRFNLEDNAYEGMYSDVKASDWYAGIIQNAYELGLISPLLTQDGSFRPDEPVTREDASIMAKSLAEYMGYAQDRTAKTFADDYAISAYAKESVYGAARIGLIDGFDDNTFRPSGTLTRAESAQMMKNIVERDGALAFYVDTQNGSEMGEGTMDNPFKTVEQAVKVLKQHNKNMKHNIYVFIKSGETFIEKPIEITPDDAGDGTYGIVFSSYGGGQAVLSGGKHYKGGWELHDAEKGIYKMFAGNVQTRQMFVNDMRMTRARTDSGFVNKSNINEEKTGYITEDTYFADYKSIEEMELVYYKDWTNPRAGVESVSVQDDGKLFVKMETPIFNYLMNKAHLAVNLPSYFENQYEFIDEDGEWYLDVDGWLYFKPYDFIDLETADVVLPVTEQLVKVTGSKDGQVKNISFINLGFKYATWLRPSSKNGYTDAQGGRLRENGDLVPDAAVQITYTKNLTVEDCTFSKMGITALNAIDWIENADIVGNHLYDLSAAGMYVGNHGTNGGASSDTYISKDIRINNNLVHDYGIDYRASDGIECMTLQYTEAKHNEVYNGRYSGLVLGYGAAGTRYAIDFEKNYIHDIQIDWKMYDGRCIYVTGETQGTEERPNRMNYNYVVNNEGPHGCLYIDNNSTNWQLYGNVVDQRRTPWWTNNYAAQWLMSNAKEANVVENNYTTTDVHKLSGVYASGNGPEAELINNHVIPDADWPEEALNVIEESGLEKKYLEKYPAQIQAFDVIRLEKAAIMLGETKNIIDLFGIKAYGRKGVEMEIDPANIIVTTDIPDAVRVNGDGTLTSTGTAAGTAKITIINGELIYQETVELLSGDEFEEAKLNKDEIKLYTGNSFKAEAVVTTKLGVAFEADSVSYAISDETVAEVAEDGTITAKSAGAAALKAIIEYKGMKTELDVPVLVKDKIRSEAFDINNYFVTDISKYLNSASKWYPEGETDIASDFEGGVKFETPGNTVGSEQVYGEELIRARMKINAEGGWPSLSIRSEYRTKSYSTNTQYMVTFRPGSLEIQKFVNGERRTFENPNFPCSFEYGKEYDIMFGAVNHDDCVEIVLCLDGEPVMRFYDYDDTRITKPGYIQVYCRAGDIVLKPVE